MNDDEGDECVFFLPLPGMEARKEDREEEKHPGEIPEAEKRAVEEE